jgi:hypothetical protein
MIATLLQVVGLVVLCAGLYVWFGTGPALVAGGIAATVSGVAVEVDRRRT